MAGSFDDFNTEEQREGLCQMVKFMKFFYDEARRQGFSRGQSMELLKEYLIPIMNPNTKKS